MEAIHCCVATDAAWKPSNSDLIPHLLVRMFEVRYEELQGRSVIDFGGHCG